MWSSSRRRFATDGESPAADASAMVVRSATSERSLSLQMRCMRATNTAMLFGVGSRCYIRSDAIFEDTQCAFWFSSISK